MSGPKGAREQAHARMQGVENLDDRMDIQTLEVARSAKGAGLDQAGHRMRLDNALGVRESTASAEF